jgi:DNA (cytosine-5)-methyltransferase 1
VVVAGERRCGVSDLTAVSLFAGIGGIDRALDLAGIEVTAAVEIDPDCRSVIARHFPRTALFNDVTEVTGDQLRATGFVPRRGVLAGGFPCQGLSQAGLRKGLADARSGLFWHVMRLADELRPRWLLLENVPGLLSSVCPCPGDRTCVAGRRAMACGEWRGNGDTREWFPDVPHNVGGGTCPGGCMAAHGGAMGTVLGALGERGYGFAYRVLDAQFFGVPQRRRRVFIAGCLGDRAAPVQVLLEPESGGGHPAQGRQAGAGTTGAPGGGAVSSLQGGGRRGHRIDAEGAAGGHLVTGTLTAGSLADYDDNTARAGHMITHALTAREAKGPDSDATSGFIVTHALTAEGADASEGGTGRGTPLVAVTSLAVAGDFSTGENVAQAVGDAGIVRRLSPLECERLQGFPDLWTLHRAGDGTEQSDSARYRQLGNSVAVPCVAWITHRIAAAESAAQARDDMRGAA